MRRLGSEDLASEILHETYVRLDTVRETIALSKPNDYIFRVAINIANDHRRSDQRRLTYSDVEALYHYVDAAVDGKRDAEARSELTALARIFDELPSRQKAILIAVRVDGTPHAELAKRLGISERMVDKDLRRALEFFCLCGCLWGSCAAVWSLALAG